MKAEDRRYYENLLRSLESMKKRNVDVENHSREIAKDVYMYSFINPAEITAIVQDIYDRVIETGRKDQYSKFFEEKHKICDDNSIAISSLDEMDFFMMHAVRGDRFCDGYFAGKVKSGIFEEKIRRFLDGNPLSDS